MVGAKKILSNIIFLISSSLFSLIISIFTTSIIARHIGPELYGKYTFGLSFILLFSVFANFGLETLFIREASRDKNNLYEMIFDILYLKIFLAILTVVLVNISIHLLGYTQSTIKIVYVLSAGLFFQIIYETIMAAYKALEKMAIVAIFASGFRIVTAIIVVIAIYTDIGIMGIVAAYSIGNFIVFTAAALLFYFKFRFNKTKPKLKNWKLLVRAGFPFYISAILSMLYYKTNILLLSKMRGDIEVGYYMAAATLVEGLIFIPDAFVISIFPAFSRIYGDSLTALKLTYYRVMKYLVILTASISTGTVLVGDRIIYLIYGDKFLPAIPVLKILIFFWVFMFFSHTMSTLLFTIKKENAQVKITGLACIVNIILNLIMIRFYGSKGAAYAMMMTEALTIGLIYCILWQNNLKYIPGISMFRLVFVWLAMFITVKMLIDMNIAIVIIGGAVSYLGFLFILKVFDSEEIVFIKSIAKSTATFDPKGIVN